LLQDVIASGTTLTNTDYAGRDGTVPTGRAGLRYSLDDSQFLRVAAYAGFRAPTLNELYRPFRVGNVVTNANAALVPEKLDGLEVGWGGNTDIVTWSATGFWNTLHDAVENATVLNALFPTSCTGGATCQQRKNVGDIDALGLEAELSESIASDFAFREAVTWTDARVHPGTAAPLLNGKRPAQAPDAVITAGAHWQPIAPLSFDADLRWVSAQYEDDINTIKLGSALTLDVRAGWTFANQVSLYGKIDNALDAKVATGNTTGVINIGAPRIFEIGIEYAQ
jgi:outer membrane receptor protein involved in Fe transport